MKCFIFQRSIGFFEGYLKLWNGTDFVLLNQKFGGVSFDRSASDHFLCLKANTTNYNICKLLGWFLLRRLNVLF